MSTTPKPTHYVASLNYARNMALLYSAACGASIVICAVVMLGTLGANGGLDQCLAVQSADTCLYALR